MEDHRLRSYSLFDAVKKLFGWEGPINNFQSSRSTDPLDSNRSNDSISNSSQKMPVIMQYLNLRKLIDEASSMQLTMTLIDPENGFIYLLESPRIEEEMIHLIVNALFIMLMARLHANRCHGETLSTFMLEVVPGMERIYNSTFFGILLPKYLSSMDLEHIKRSTRFLNHIKIICNTLPDKEVTAPIKRAYQEVVMKLKKETRPYLSLEAGDTLSSRSTSESVHLDSCRDHAAGCKPKAVVKPINLTETSFNDKIEQSSNILVQRLNTSRQVAFNSTQVTFSKSVFDNIPIDKTLPVFMHHQTNSTSISTSQESDLSELSSTVGDLISVRTEHYKLKIEAEITYSHSTIPSNYTERKNGIDEITIPLSKLKTQDEIENAPWVYFSAENLDVPVRPRSKLPCMQNFRKTTVVPTLGDVHQTVAPFVTPNLISGPYESAEQYVAIHFQLLREDFLTPLRNGIQRYIARKSGKLKYGKTDPDIRFYENVLILHSVGTKQGLCHKIQFDAEPFQNVNREDCDYLKYGSLVCLSKDNFRTILFGTVNTRYEDAMSRGIIDICFCDLYGVHSQNHEGVNLFVMAEPGPFFEAYRYVLEALKNLKENAFPLKRYVLYAENQVQSPSYLNDDTEYDISPLFKNSSDYGNTIVSVLKPNSWPKPEKIGLNPSQLKALIMALSSELALIQGPPGTGKTFIGLKIIQVLLHNRDKWTSYGMNGQPIVVVCFTNHALDQFLEGVVDLTTNVVRIGNQSTSEKLEKYNYRELKFQAKKSQKKDQKKLKEINRLYRFIGPLESRMQKVGKLINKTLTTICGADVFISIMSDQHKTSLKQHSYTSGLSDVELMTSWLMFSDMLTNYDLAAEDFETDEESKTVILAEHSRNKAIQKMPTNSSERWQLKTRKLTRQQLEKKLCIFDAMTKNEADHVRNVWELDARDRWRLYRYWVVEYRHYLQRELRAYEGIYSVKKADVARLQSDIEVDVLSKSEVIGLTTTAAARLRPVLEKLEPPIVVIEEAAEVLEGHIIASLSKYCKHLILIGDHMQLRPNPEVYELATDHRLNVSLFERLINNGIQHQQLMLQHRMRPCIARLLVPHIYQALDNDESVCWYDHIAGVGSDMYFVQHQNPEHNIVDSTTKANSFEANYLIQLCRYLIFQGYDQSQITMLATYSGQVALLRNLLLLHRMLEVTVSTVDNYQGEENDIVLLSLVRSNHQENIGFLNVTNRVCVALSRARMGLYVIGNIQLLAKKSDLWKDIMKYLQQGDYIGTGLPAICERHPNTTTWLRTLDDFTDVKNGGCSRKCGIRLSCSHPCRLKCHPKFQRHKCWCGAQNLTEAKNSGSSSNKTNKQSSKGQNNNKKEGDYYDGVLYAPNAPSNTRKPRRSNK